MSELQIQTGEKVNNRKLVGTYQQSKNYGFVIPDNRRMSADIFIPIEKSGGASDGLKVIAEITAEAKEEERKSPEGKIVEILGDRDEPGIDILSVIRSYELPDAFTERELRRSGWQRMSARRTGRGAWICGRYGW